MSQRPETFARMGSDPSILVLGADGAIGRALVARCHDEGLRVIGTTRRERNPQPGRVYFDLSECPSAAWTLPEADVALLCAAVTSYHACRADPAGTAFLNVDRTVQLAAQLAAAGSFVVYVSSGSVFRGEVPYQPADSPPSPVSEYGRQKAEAESRLLGLGTSSAVVRISKIFEPTNALLRSWMVRLRDGESISPFADLVMAPVPLSCAVEVLLRVGTARASGIFQLSGDRDITYFDAGQRLARRLGAPVNRVTPGRAADAGLGIETLPRHATLDTSRLERELGLAAPSSFDAVDGVQL